jgi:hypothetical protein
VPKCVKCGKEGKQVKQWSYGPKTRKGASFTVTIFQCPNNHKWREYKKKETANVYSQAHSIRK